MLGDALGDACPSRAWLLHVSMSASKPKLPHPSWVLLCHISIAHNSCGTHMLLCCDGCQTGGCGMWHVGIFAACVYVCISCMRVCIMCHVSCCMLHVVSYYHLFKRGELEDPNAAALEHATHSYSITQAGFDHENWYADITKGEAKKGSCQAQRHNNIDTCNTTR